MNKTVEALTEPCTVAKGAGTAFHQQHNPMPCCVIDPADIPAAVGKLLKAIVEISRSRHCGALLFITDDMNAYVINEERAIAQVWVVSHWHEFVGNYTHTPRRGLTPDPAGMVEDIGCHLADLARTAR